MSQTNWMEDLKKNVEEEHDELVAININQTLYRGIDELKEAMTRLDRVFDGGFGGTNGESFWAWGKKNIYFCVVYDGSEWIECIPRNPSKGSPTHYGGQ